MTETILTATCDKCKSTLSIEQFHFKYKAKNIRRTTCKDCCNALSRQHYEGNKQYYLDRNQQQRKKHRNKIKELKQSHPCTDCGQTFPYYVMEFDHINPENKSFNIGRSSKMNSFKQIQEEIAKCDIVCANCHKIRSFKRKRGMSLEP